MENLPSELTGASFWLALALIVMAVVWMVVKKQQMKHELTLKVLEKGNDASPELLALLAKQLTAQKAGPGFQPKPLSEQHLDGGSFMTLLFVVPGMIMMAVGVMGDAVNWWLVALGALSFLYGNLCWRGAYKRYLEEKAEEKAEAQSSRD